MTIHEWYETLNKHVFFWTTKDRLFRLMNAALYRNKKHTVLTVDPELLLARKYDRVIIVHRDLDILLKVYNLYYPPDLSDAQRERFIQQAKRDYKKVYGHQFNNPRCLWVNLDDLNKYTVDTVKELMDFLNFPEYGRRSPWVVKPPGLRDSESYSSVLDKGYGLTGNLERISGEFTLRDGILEYSAHVRNSKRIPELKRIAIIGPRIYKGCHLSENLYNAFRGMGYRTSIIADDELGLRKKDTLNRMYQAHKLLYPISKAIRHLSEKPELIIVDEPSLYFYNNVDIPVFYAHREFKRPPKVYYPDIGLFWHRGITRYFKKMFAPHWAANTPKLMELHPAVEPTQFKLVKKTIPGISNFAGREKLGELIHMKELTATALVRESYRKMLKVISYGINYIKNSRGGLTDLEFRTALAQCEACWVLQPSSQYISRRMLEAMLCKTVVILKLENKEHEDTFTRMGFNKNEHYINIEKLSDLKDLQKSWNYAHHSDMVKKAYKVVMENHTFINRAELLIELYNDYKLRHRGVIIE